MSKKPNVPLPPKPITRESTGFGDNIACNIFGAVVAIGIVVIGISMALLVTGG